MRLKQLAIAIGAGWLLTLTYLAGLTAQGPIYQRPLSGSNFSAGIGYGTALPSSSNSGTDPGDGELFMELATSGSRILHLYDGTDQAWYEVGGADSTSTFSALTTGTLTATGTSTLAGTLLADISNVDDTDTGVRFDDANGIQLLSGGNYYAAYKVASGTMDSATVLQLNGSPVEAVADPAATTALWPLSAFFLLEYNSAAYAGVDAGEDLTIQYITSNDDLLVCDNSTCLDATVTADAIGLTERLDSIGGIQLDIGQGLEINISVGNWTMGNSSIHWAIEYIEIDLTDYTTP